MMPGSGRGCASWEPSVFVDPRDPAFRGRPIVGGNVGENRTQILPGSLRQPPANPWAFVHVRVLPCVATTMIPASCTVRLLDVAFRFRYRKVCGFDSLLVHSSEIIGESGFSLRRA